MPVVLDTKAEVFARYGLFGTPGTFIADNQGILVANGVGPVDFDRLEFRTHGNAMSAGRHAQFGSS
jgi:hypothetical protein